MMSYIGGGFCNAASVACPVPVFFVHQCILFICPSPPDPFLQGMWNWTLNFSLVFETLVAAALVYIPFLNQVFETVRLTSSIGPAPCPSPFQSSSLANSENYPSAEIQVSSNLFTD